MIRTAARARDDVINREVAKRENDPAAVANAFLKSKKGMFLRSVMWYFAYVSTLWDVQFDD